LSNSVHQLGWIVVGGFGGSRCAIKDGAGDKGRSIANTVTTVRKRYVSVRAFELFISGLLFVW
jgi:hypothetical protein